MTQKPPQPANAPGPDTSEVTRLLKLASDGDREVFDQLLPLVYAELRSLAGSKLRMERADHTLNATALVHEAYMKLVQQDRVEWQNRAHFFAVASRAMRRILIDYARARGRDRRGGAAPHAPLHEVEDAASDLFTEDQATELLALDEALRSLEDFDPEGAEVVQYRFFGGLTHGEVAEVVGASEVTVRRRWRAARSWLRQQLAPELFERTGTLITGAGT